MRRTRIRKLNERKKNDIFKIAGIIIAFLIIFIIIISNLTMNVFSVEKAINSSEYSKIDISWERTKEYRTNFWGYAYGVVRANDYDNKYWEISGNEYILNRTNNEKGILRTEKLVAENNKNIVLDYNTLLGNDGILTDMIEEGSDGRKVWDGKGESSYFTDYKNQIEEIGRAHV